jgi:carbamoyltransferase
VVSNDGFGDGLCAKVAVPDKLNGALRVISSNHFANSLGAYYNYVTHFCGFNKSHHAGKTTGLAAYGDPEKTLPIFQRLIEWDAERGIYVNRGKLFGNCLRDIHAKLAGFSREDAAAGIQRHCENILGAMVRHYVERTGRRKIVLTGGVHANVKVNQRIAEIPGVETVFVFPNMGDGGLALGAAFLTYARVNPGGAVPVHLDDVYLGPGYSEREIANCLNRAGVAFSRPDRLAAEVARLLKENKIVARFDGRMEYGPRALGNRSILYPATNPSVNQWLNTQLRRTEFMPFAPVVREADAAAFFLNYDKKTAHTAEFMTITYNVTDRCRKEAPAIVHVDGTARPQVLRRSVNPGYYDILEEYHKLTGLSVLVNTSFNMHEEPIVCTPDDALKAFFESHLDAIAIGPFLVLNSRK